MSRIAHFAAGLALASALFFVPSAVRADEPTPAEIAVARRLYGEAVQLEQAGKWAEAEKKLREAIAIKETAGLRFHLAVAQEKQGDLVAALVDFDRADELIQLGARAPDVKQLLGPAREAVRARIPTLTIGVPADARGVVLAIDGKSIKSQLVGKAIPLNPGKHTIRVTASGKEPFETELSLEESEKRVLDVELEPSARSEAPMAGSGTSFSEEPSEPGADRGGGPSTRTVVLVGEVAFTAIALGLGIGFTIQKADRQDQVDAANAEVDRLAPGQESACSAPTDPALKESCDALAEFSDERDHAGTIAAIGFVAAGVGAAATVATFVLWKPETETSVGVVPVPGGALLGVGGRF